jgi:sugar lactone lactonase YvrE
VGTLPASAPATPWTAPAGLSYPAQATWEGGLVAPTYGQYVFAVQGGDGVLAIDGTAVLTATGSAPEQRQVTLALAKGMHDVRLQGTLHDAQTRLDLRWGNAPSSLSAIPANFLYNGPTGGLSGEAGRYNGQDLTAPDIFAGQQTIGRRSDPAIGFRHAADVFRDPGFLVRWQGTIQIPATGIYQFEMRSNAGSALLIDGQVVVSNPSNGNINSAGNAVTLQAGPHTVDIRYTWQTGAARMEWFWTPPDGQRALVPPTVLRPLARSWPPGAVDAPSGVVPDLQPPAAIAPPVAPEKILPVEVQAARGLAVAPDGTIYVADTGNHRVLALTPDGKVARQWGTATDTAGPGQFRLLGDVAVTPDGAVVTVDNDGDLQIFTPQGEVKQRLPGMTSNGNGLDVTPDGRIWVADTSNGRVAVFADGTLAREFRGATGEGPGHLNQPLDVAVAPDGAIYVVDLVARLVRLDADGKPTGLWPSEVGAGTGVSHLVLWHNQLVMTDPERNHLVVLDPASGTIRQVGAAGRNPGQFQLPTGIAVGPDGKLYVLDSGNGRIQVFNTLDSP